MTLILDVVDIHTYYGDSYVLQGVSLKAEEGRVLTLLGRNGMGKTTIINSIIGFTPPRRGVVKFRGREVTRFAPNRIARMGVGLVPQGRRVFSSLSVRENLTMAKRGGEKRGAWSLDRVYSLFPILKERSSFKGNILSGGEQQMLTIGRALMTNPDLLLMDEPSEGLAPLIVREVGRVIKELNRSGLSIVLVEQNLRLALELAHYAYVVSKGEVVYESTVEELKRNEEVKAKHLGIAS